VLFTFVVSVLAKRLTGKTTLMISITLKGFPYRDHTEDYNGLLYVFPTRNVFNFFINFTYLTATYLSKPQYRLFVLKVPLKPNQSVNQCEFGTTIFHHAIVIFNNFVWNWIVLMKKCRETS